MAAHLQAYTRAGCPPGEYPVNVGYEPVCDEYRDMVTYEMCVRPFVRQPSFSLGHKLNALKHAIATNHVRLRAPHRVTLGEG